MHKVVVNATPIISLCHIDQLHLLKKLYGEILIPEAVYYEISAKHDSITKEEIDKSLDWVHVCRISNELARDFFKSQLHAGEVEVMILGKEVEATLLIIDDKNAKRHAKYLQFAVTGTLGVLLKAKKEGYIRAVKPLIEKLFFNGIFLDDRIIAFCLEQAGE